MQYRSVAKVIILSLLTLGIYQLYWLSATKREMISRGAKIPSLWWLLSPLLLFLGVAALQLGAHFILSSQPSDTGTVSPVASFVNVASVLLGVLAVVGMVPASLWWLYRYCQGVEQVTQGKTSVALSFCSAILTAAFSLGFIWPGIIQDGFNKTTQQPTA